MVWTGFSASSWLSTNGYTDSTPLAAVTAQDLMKFLQVSFYKDPDCDETGAPYTPATSDRWNTCKLISTVSVSFLWKNYELISCKICFLLSPVSYTLLLLTKLGLLLNISNLSLSPFLSLSVHAFFSSQLAPPVQTLPLYPVPWPATSLTPVQVWTVVCPAPNWVGHSGPPWTLTPVHLK